MRTGDNNETNCNSYPQNATGLKSCIEDTLISLKKLPAQVDVTIDDDIKNTTTTDACAVFEPVSTRRFQIRITNCHNETKIQRLLCRVKCKSKVPVEEYHKHLELLVSEKNRTESELVQLKNNDNNQEPCPFDSSPRLVGSVGGLLEGTTLVFCGGHYTDPDTNETIISNKCFTPGNLTPVAEMKEGRTYAAAVVINDGKTLLVNGGNNQKNMSLGSTELIDIFSDSSLTHASLKLPFMRERSSHCIAKINDKEIFVGPGSKYKGELGSYAAQRPQILNIITGKKILLTRLATVRLQYSCGVITTGAGTQFVVVAGGFSKYTLPHIQYAKYKKKSIGKWQEIEALNSIQKIIGATLGLYGDSMIAIARLKDNTTTVQKVTCNHKGCRATSITETTSSGNLADVLMVPRGQYSCSANCTHYRSSSKRYSW